MPRSLSGPIIPAVCLALVGCAQSPSTPAPASGTTGVSFTPYPGGKAPPPADPAKDAPTFTGTLQDLFKQTRTTSGKYIGQVIQVEGVVTGASRSRDGGRVVMAVGPDLDRETVSFELKDRSPWDAACPGRTAGIKGRVSVVGPKSAELKDCVVVSAEKPDGSPLTAEALAAEYGKDRAGVEKKYAGKQLVVTGVVEPSGSDGPGVLRLKGSGRVAVRCSFDLFERPDAAGVKPGQAVRLVGKFSDGSQGEVSLEDSHLLKDAKE